MTAFSWFRHASLKGLRFLFLLIGRYAVRHSVKKQCGTRKLIVCFLIAAQRYLGYYWPSLGFFYNSHIFLIFEVKLE